MADVALVPEPFEGPTFDSGSEDDPWDLEGFLVAAVAVHRYWHGAFAASEPHTSSAVAVAVGTLAHAGHTEKWGHH